MPGKALRGLMDAAFVVDWLNLLLRWAHMIVGIAWIGASFYFIWLDNHLHKPLDPADSAKGIGGEVWAVHGGGFYTAKKFTVAPERLPPELHWFKWEAYTTLVTGFFLLCLVYYYGAEVALIDPAVLPLTQPQAIAIGLGSLVVGCSSTTGCAARPWARTTSYWAGSSSSIASSRPGRSATYSPAAAPISISAPCSAPSWC